ncbi:MAG: hypothetical protein WC518_02345 [Patescibacteria group bacterium]
MEEFKMKKDGGKLLVLEGGDGSGKATQTRMLVERLRRQGRDVFTLDFPRYDETFGGKIARAYLDGQFGDPKNIDPYLASIPYAMDRYESLPALHAQLNKGGLVVVDRFHTANFIHQGAKMGISEDGQLNEPALHDLVSFLQRLEFELLGIPQPDLVLYLHVAPPVAQTLMDSQGRVKDGHEKDVAYAKKVERVALWACEALGWKLIECCPDEQTILSPEAVSDLIWNEVERAI